MVKNLLIIECTSTYNWYKVFDGATLTSGEELRIEQASWQEFSCTGYYDSGLIVELQKARRPLHDTPQDRGRTIKPHFVLMRSLSQFLDDSSRNFLYALQFCNIPMINSFSHCLNVLFFSTICQWLLSFNNAQIRVDLRNVGETGGIW